MCNSGYRISVCSEVEPASHPVKYVEAIIYLRLLFQYINQQQHRKVKIVCISLLMCTGIMLLWSS